MNKIIDGIEINSWVNRNLSEDLVYWKDMPLGILLYGPRQAGKTMLLKAFGQERFSRFTYLDLGDKETRERFETLCKANFEAHNYSPGNGAFIVEALDEMGLKLENTPETLLIIGEIQDSPYAYGIIRNIVRSLKCKVAFTGSYLGDILFKPEVRESAGDVARLDLETISYLEFLRSLPIYDDYKKIDIFDYNSFRSQKGSELKSALKNSYYDYCQIGGYPKVVSSYLEGMPLDKCLSLRDQIGNDFYSECSRRIAEIPELRDWEEILGRIALGVVNGKEWDSVLKSKEHPTLKGISSKSSEDIERIVKWFNVSKMIDSSYVTTTPFLRGSTSPYVKLFFTDLGFLRYMISKTSGFMLESDARGFLAENFVFLALRDLKYLFSDKSVWKYDSKGLNGIFEESDFIKFALGGRKRILIEVKSKRGKTPTADKVLARGEADYIVKIADAEAKIGETHATLPFYAIDRLESIVEMLEAGKIGLQTRRAEFFEYGLDSADGEPQENDLSGEED
jgi:predicted AAA+ superfamily ATPase